ncbi:MAG: heptaprenyl diphosphate synthase [Proteobacteria bacterium]|nr:heptaprenyl diphosphate synthase [Pseudomonadota bacterium]
MKAQPVASLDLPARTPSDVRLSLLAAIATALHVAEAALPTFGPVKPGFANAVVLVVWKNYGLKPALTVNLLRLACGALLSGSLISPRFGLAAAGFVLSSTGLCFGKKLTQKGVSMYGLSVLCAWLHMLGQLLALRLCLPDFPLGGAAPWLLGYALLAGLATGWLATQLDKPQGATS